MIKMRGKIFLLLWLSIVDMTTPYDGELLTAMIYVREGEHSPVVVFKEDPLYDYWKTIGRAQLTMQGQRRMYKLGKWLRERYGDDIPKRYSRGVAFAGAVNCDASMISASLVLAGLFPPLEDQIFEEKIKWQPIPVHTQPEEDMTFLVSDSNLVNMELAILNLVAESEKDKRKLEKLLGIKIESNVNLYAIFDSVIAAQNMNYEGQWTSVETVEVLQGLIVKQLRSFGATSELTKWKLEPFFNEIHLRFLRFEDYDYDEDEEENVDEEYDELEYGYRYKAVLFAGNLETMISMLHGAKVLGLFDIPAYMPDFGDALIFELREGKQGNRYVNVFYKNSAGEIRQYPIIDCGMDCDSKLFINRMSAILNNDLDFPELAEPQPMKKLNRFKRTAEMSNITLPYDVFTEPNQFIE